MILGNRTTEEEVLANFALAEISSPKWTKFMLQYLSPEELQYLRETEFGEWSPSMRELAVKAILRHRDPFLKGILATRPDWIEATVTVAEVGNFRTPARVGNETLASDLKVDSIVKAVRAGRPGNPTYSGELTDLKTDFDTKLLRGKPILIATRPTGPFVIIEGTHRLPVVYWRRLESLPCPTEVEVLLGTSEELVNWFFFPQI